MVQVIWGMLDHPRIFFHQSVSEHNSVWFMCVCTPVCMAMSVGTLEMQCMALLKSWVTVHPTMEE